MARPINKRPISQSDVEYLTKKELIIERERLMDLVTNPESEAMTARDCQRLESVMYALKIIEKFQDLGIKENIRQRYL